MTHTKIPISQLIILNLKWVMAFLFGVFAYTLFPDHPTNWGWGVISILCGLSAFALLIQAIRLMLDIHRHEKALWQQHSKGRGMQSAQLADDSILNDAGAMDD